MTRTHGPAGVLNAFGQIILGEHSRFSHALIVLDEWTVIEAWPEGARWATLNEYEDEPIAYGYRVPLSKEQRADIVSAARGLDGTPYGLRDYLTHRLWRMGARPRWLRHRLEDQSRLLPAQLVAEAYRRAGVRLAPTGRSHLDVTMRDLSALFFDSHGWELHVPNAHLI